MVGNSAYQSAAKLKNATNDAIAVGNKLKALGFEVMGGGGGGAGANVGLDLDRKASVQQFAAFVDRISAGDTVFIFYAGHGLQIADENYLVPVDASLAGEEPLSQLIRMRAMIEQAARKAGRNGTTIVFLDACRENPFSNEQLANLAKGASRSISTAQQQPDAISLVHKGFATMKMQSREDASATFISFATAPGDVAYDGAGGNSPFTQAVLDHIDVRGLSLDDFIDRVAVDVLDRSERAGRYQDPWYESNLRQNFYFKPASWSPVIFMTLIGAVVGAMLTFLLLHFNAFNEAIQGQPTNAPPWIYFIGIIYGGMVGTGVAFWGSGKTWHAIFVAVLGALAVALAIFILQTPIVQPKANTPLLGNEPLSLESIKDRVRLQNFLANSKIVSLSVLVLLAGLILTTITAAALKVQGGGFRGFGTLVGSMIVGVLLPFLAVAMLWWAELAGDWGKANIMGLAIGIGAVWFAILGWQLGYCLMYHVPDHKRIGGTRR